MAETLDDVLRALSPEQRDEVRMFAEALLHQTAHAPGRKPEFQWAGALRDVRGQYTSVELQHELARWRIGGA